VKRDEARRSEQRRSEEGKREMEKKLEGAREAYIMRMNVMKGLRMH
jgi:hypothetical protein